MSHFKVEPNEIGWMFVPQFYTFLHKDPSRLHCFYTKKSTFIHGNEGEECPPRYGQQEIHDRIMSLNFEDCKVYVSNVDSQSSAEGGIIVQVLGEMSNKGGPWRKFAQTFFLAEQPNGYFVLNDIFRYLKEDGDELHGEDDVSAAADLGRPHSPSTSLKPDSPAVQQPVAPVTEFGTAPLSHTYASYPEPVAPLPFTNSAEQAQANGYHPESQPISEPRTGLIPENAPPAQVPVRTQLEEIVQAPIPSPEPQQPIQAAPAPVSSPAAPERVPEGKPEAPKQPAAPAPAPAAPVEEPVPAQVVEPEATPVPAASPSQQKPTEQAKPAAEPVAAQSAPSPAQSQPAAPTPSAPVRKSWATLAAGAPKGKVVADARGVIVSAASTSSLPSSSQASVSGEGASSSKTPVPSTAQAQASSPTQHNTSAGSPSTSYPRPHFRFDPATFNQSTCYVKNVERDIPQGLSKQTIIKRFGPLHEMDFDFGRNCAFLDFVHVESAKKAIMASLPPFMGGEGGVAITQGGKTWTLIIEPKRGKGERQAAALAAAAAATQAGSNPTSGANNAKKGRAASTTVSGEDVNGQGTSTPMHKKTASTQKTAGKNGAQQGHRSTSSKTSK